MKPATLSWRKISAAAMSAAVLSMAIPALPAPVSVQTKIQNTAMAAATPPAFSGLKSVDIMKFTKDTMTSQPSDATIDNLVSTLAAMPITHIAVSVPMDAAADYPASGKPNPNDPYVFTQKLADTIHAKGLKVIWRGTWSGIEGIYGFPKLVGASRFPAGTASSAATDGNTTWLGKTYRYIVSHPSFFADGDVWAPLPERTEGIFQDSTSFLPYSGAGIQANYANFFIDLNNASRAAFSVIGKNVVTGMSANNYTEILSTWMPPSLINDNSIIAIDYYGNNHTPEEIYSDFKKMSAGYGKPVFLQEWGDYWNTNLDEATRTRYLQSVYATLQKLVDEGTLVGFNYWGGWDNAAEGILTQNNGTFQLNYRGQLLSQLFAANTLAVPQPSPSPTPTPVQPVALTCPGPSSGSFTGCYYTDKNLSNLGLARTDSSINFDWSGGSPDAKLPADNFSARWQGSHYFSGGSYTFTMTSDDGSRLYIDDQLVLNAWSDHAAQTFTVTKTLTDGYHLVTMEYYEAYGGSVAKLSWKQNLTVSPIKKRFWR